MIRVAIVDDEIYILKKIQTMIMREFDAHRIACSYFSYTSAKDFIEAQRKQPFDIAFLDIIMPEYTGFQAAAEVRNLQNQTYIIFITSNDESVYDSFDFQPFQFICKDCDDIFQNRIKHVITSLVRHLKQNRTLIFQLPFSEESVTSLHSRAIEIIWKLIAVMVLSCVFGKNYLKWKLSCFPMISFVFTIDGS